MGLVCKVLVLVLVLDQYHLHAASLDLLFLCLFL